MSHFIAKNKEFFLNLTKFIPVKIVNFPEFSKTLSEYKKNFIKIKIFKFYQKWIELNI